MPSQSLVYKSRIDLLLTGARPFHTCGSGKMLKQLDVTSRPLAGCNVCVVSLYSFFPPPTFSGEEEKFGIERNLVLAVPPTIKPYPDHLKLVKFV